MQYDKKPRLLQKIQMQVLAVELEKAEAEEKIWWRSCLKKWELATMSILMIVSVCGWISS